jgi:acetolactate synthase-like protein
MLKKKQIGKEENIFLVSFVFFVCRKKGLESTEIHLNPIRILQELENQLPDNAILVGDGGDFVATAAYILRPRAPLTWLDPGAFGTLGVGAGFALGAKLVRPEASVWIIYGDGALGYSIMEYDTFVRHKVYENCIDFLLIIFIY